MTATRYSLVGDIGGTNARFALVEQGTVQPRAIKILPCGEYANLDDAVRDYLARVGVSEVDGACLAVASPVRVCVAGLSFLRVCGCVSAESLASI